MASTLVPWLEPHLWGTDRFFNEIRLVALTDCAREGILWPRWLPSLAHGHGFPLFHYYPAGLYLLALPFHLLGLPPRPALLLVLTLAVALAAWCICRAVARRAGPGMGLLAGLLWITAPYLQVDLQVRHAWAELLGLCFLAVAVTGLLDLALGDRRLAAWARAVLGGVAVILTHNVVALFLGAAALLLAAAPGLATGRRSALRVLAAFGVAVGVTAFFWLPALLDAELVRVDRMSDGFYSFESQAVALQQLLDPRFGYGPSVPGPDDEMNLSVGLGHGLAVIGLLAWALARPRRVSTRGWVWTGAVLALVVLLLPLAAPLYEVLPLLSFVQAPFRLLGPLAVLLALHVPLLVHRTIPAPGRRLVGAAVGAVALLSLVPAFTSPREMSAQEVAAFEPVREDGAAGIPRLRDPYATTAGFLEYLPRTVATYPTAPTEQRLEAPPWITVTDVVDTCAGVEAQGHAAEPGVVRLNLFGFPGHALAVNGAAVPFRVAPDVGFVLAPIPAEGTWSLRLDYDAPPSAAIGTSLSLLTLLALLAAVLRARGRDVVERAAPAPRSPTT